METSETFNYRENLLARVLKITDKEVIIKIQKIISDLEEEEIYNYIALAEKDGITLEEVKEIKQGFLDLIDQKEYHEILEEVGYNLNKTEFSVNTDGVSSDDFNKWLESDEYIISNEILDDLD